MTYDQMLEVHKAISAKIMNIITTGFENEIDDPYSQLRISTLMNFQIKLDALITQAVDEWEQKVAKAEIQDLNYFDFEE
jgi:hypothetical protein